jgi:hypothetical protein
MPKTSEIGQFPWQQLEWGNNFFSANGYNQGLASRSCLFSAMVFWLSMPATEACFLIQAFAIFAPKGLYS